MSETVSRAITTAVAIALRDRRAELPPVIRKRAGGGGTTYTRAPGSETGFIEDQIVSLISGPMGVALALAPDEPWDVSRLLWPDRERVLSLAREITSSPEEAEELLGRLVEQAQEMLFTPTMLRKVAGLASEIRDRGDLSGFEAEQVYGQY